VDDLARTENGKVSRAKVRDFFREQLRPMQLRVDRAAASSDLVPSSLPLPQTTHRYAHLASGPVKAAAAAAVAGSIDDAMRRRDG
jgi:hypothetical protein